MNTSDKIRTMAIAPSNTQVLFAASRYNIWKTVNGGTSWTEITGTLPVASGSITYITVKNDDASTLWITMSGYGNNNVFQSSNGGTTWTNMSTGLPQVPAFTIVQNKQSTSEVQLYAGTELGVYFKKGTANWIPYNTNLPNVKIGELEIYYAASPANSKIRAATFGRGIWESNVYYLVPAISVTVPNGGESWVAGSAQTITWTDNIDENVKIELYKGGSFNATIIGSTPSNGSYSWTIPAGQAVGNDYKVKITSITSSIVSDMSDANFSIISVPLQSVLTIGTISGATPGPVVLPVHAANIVNMGSFQFTVEYDATKLYYSSTSNWYTGITSVTVAEATPGHLSFIWTATTGGVSIPDGTFFNINFIYLTGSSTVIWSDNPATREFTDWDGNTFIPTYVNGSVSGTGNVPVLSVTPSNQNVASSPGTTSFTVTNIGSGTMTYTSEVTAGSDWLTITGGGSGGNSGTINVSFTQNPGSVIRVGTITVTAPGAVGSPAQVTVTQAPAVPAGPALTIGTVSVSVSGPVVIPVHASNIVNMGSFQFTVDYDVT